MVSRCRLNYAENLLRRQDERRFAMSFHGENGETRRLSYNELYHQVSRLARALRMTESGPVIASPAFCPTFLKPWLRCWQPPASVQSGVVVPRISGCRHRRPFQPNSPQVLFVSDGYFSTARRLIAPINLNLC